MQKALIVKDDGLIYAAEVPKEPNITDYGDDEYLYPIAHYTYDMEDYDNALAYAKENAVLCADQEKAKNLIGDNLFVSGAPTGYEPQKGCIYPIPDLQWTVKEEDTVEDGGGCYVAGSRQVAILKESTPNVPDDLSEYGERMMRKYSAMMNTEESTPSENQQIIDYLEARTQVAAIIRGKVDKSQVFGLTEQILQWAASQSTPSTEQETAIRDYSRFKDSKLFTEQGRCSFKNQCDAESTPYKEQFCGCYNEEQRLKTEQESQEKERLIERRDEWLNLAKDLQAENERLKADNNRIRKALAEAWERKEADLKACWEASEDSWEYDQMIGWRQNYNFNDWINPRKP